MDSISDTTTMADMSSITRLLELPVWVFDMDGVVVDSSAIHAQAFREVFGEIGIRSVDYDKIAGRSTREVVVEQLQKSGKRLAQGLVDDLTRKKQSRALELMNGGSGLVCPPGLVDLLIIGMNGGKLICLVTSASGERTEKTLDFLEMRNFFTYIVSADDVTKGKPDPESYLALLTLTGIQDTRSYLVFEDSANGIESALVAGMRVIHYAPKSVENSRAHATIKSFDILVRALKAGDS